MPILEKGLVHIYTGEGKGKTTASLGLAWRMLGWGAKVYICQFLKPANRKTGETILAGRFADALTLDQLDLEWDIKTSALDPKMRRKMKEAITQKLLSIRILAREGGYALMILDGLLGCLSLGLITENPVLELLNDRATHVEIVLTGRGATAALIDAADLVTDMKSIKHPYDGGLAARKGIEL